MGGATSDGSGQIVGKDTGTTAYADRGAIEYSQSIIYIINADSIKGSTDSGKGK